MQVEMSLHRELTASQPRHNARVESEAGPLYIFLGLGELERRVT